LFFTGKIFAYPTDTIYGLGANPFNQQAVLKLNLVKKRDLDKQYIFLVGSIDILRKYISVVDENHYDFLISIWPNPISVVLNLNKDISTSLGIEKAAFRIPNNAFCLKFLNETKMPLISTSVNRRDDTPLNDAGMIQMEFMNEIDAIFVSKKKSMNCGSTLIDLTGNIPVLIREGKIRFEDILARFYEHQNQ
jgi:L-threonylcarbamoyladenylate synthase